MGDNLNANRYLNSSRLSGNLESSIKYARPNLLDNTSDYSCSNTHSSATSYELKQLLKNPKTFFQNKYVKAVLYIILILYASVIAPKLPNWIIYYLEYPIVKLFIVFIVGLLASQDTTAAIIATIGVTITYLFISEYKDTNDIQKIYDDENDKNDENNETKKMCNQSIKSNVEHFNTNDVTTTYNVEHFNTKNENTAHNVEYFDVLDNNNNTYINHIEEHFNMFDNKENEIATEHLDIIAYDRQNNANNSSINY
jgi:hypothetical protein